MGRKININSSNNPAKNFGVIVKDLEKIAKARNIPVQEAIKMFITDLQNLGDEEYENSIQEISIQSGISPKMKTSLITYLNRSIKRYKQSEKNNIERKKQDERKQELEKAWESIETEIADKENIKDLILGIKEGTEYPHLGKTQRSYVLKKLEALLLQEEKEEEKQEKDKDRIIRKRWKSIVETVNYEAENSGKHRLEIWDMITESIIKNGNFSNINFPETMQEEVLALIGEQAKIEGEEYFESVKDYTQNFEFLEGFRGISFAIHGHRKFSNPEYARMFENLIKELRKNKSVKHKETEERFLKRVLSEKKVNTYYGTKIIEERIERIEKDKKNEMSYTR